jgi:hypothetical protein
MTQGPSVSGTLADFAVNLARLFQQLAEKIPRPSQISLIHKIKPPSSSGVNSAQR